MIWVFGENIVYAKPNITHTEKCLSSAEFFLVQDILPNETIRFAHVILSSAAWCEDEGTFTSIEKRVSKKTHYGSPLIFCFTLLPE